MQVNAAIYNLNTVYQPVLSLSNLLWSLQHHHLTKIYPSIIDMSGVVSFKDNVLVALSKCCQVITQHL